MRCPKKKTLVVGRVLTARLIPISQNRIATTTTITAITTTINSND
jgi:hypothetical protein